MHKIRWPWMRRRDHEQEVETLVADLRAQRDLVRKQHDDFQAERMMHLHNMQYYQMYQQPIEPVVIDRSRVVMHQPLIGIVDVSDESDEAGSLTFPENHWSVQFTVQCRAYTVDEVEATIRLLLDQAGDKLRKTLLAKPTRQRTGGDR